MFAGTEAEPLRCVGSVLFEEGDRPLGGSGRPLPTAGPQWAPRPGAQGQRWALWVAGSVSGAGGETVMAPGA